MNIEHLFTEKTTINLSVVKLHNQKINKTIFNQLITLSPFNRIFSLGESVKFLGFVNDKIQWILWTDDISIYKYQLRKLKEFCHFDLDSGEISDFTKIYPYYELQYFNKSSYRDDTYDEVEKLYLILSQEERSRLEEKQRFIVEVIDKLTQRQIFI